MVGHLHVDRVDGGLVPAVQGDPLPRLVLAELPYLVAVVGVRDHLVDPAVQVLRAAGAVTPHVQRGGRGGAEADVGQPDAAVGLDAERQVRAGAERAAGVWADPGKHAVDGEAEALKDRAEELGLLVAVAAATAVDDLLLNVLQVDAYLPLQENVEVLEANHLKVRSVEGG